MTLDAGVTARLENHLEEGEQVVWQGHPLPGIRNLRWRALTTLFGLGLLVWGAFGLGDLVHHFTREGLFFNLPFFLLFAVAAVAGGLHYVYFQWRAAAQAHLSTRYVLTNRCVYIMVGTGIGSLKRYRIHPDTVIELDRHDGYSDIWFHVRNKHAPGTTETTERVGFEGISDGGTAFRLLRGLQTRQG